MKKYVVHTGFPRKQESKTSRQMKFWPIIESHTGGAHFNEKKCEKDISG